MNRIVRRHHRFTLLAAAAATTLLATNALAHSGDHWPIAGSSLKMSSSANGGENAFQFKSKKQLNINGTSVSENPQVERSTLLVRNVGTSPATTEIIELNPGKWFPIGKIEAPKGWKYKADDYAYNGLGAGISKIQIKAGKSTGTGSGSLQIQAKGYFWPFEINGPQDKIEIVLTIGEMVFCAEFSNDREAEFKLNDGDANFGEVMASDSLAPSHCPDVCGNGVTDDGEQCDDGNLIDGDTCSNTCVGCDVSEAEYASTFEGIQDKIFDGYGCSNATCHGSINQESGLDLRAGNSYDELIGVTGEINPNYVRVYPGDQDLSLLYRKIAMRTLGSPGVGGQGMPFTGTAVTEDHLEALRLWIRGGAPETGVVAETAELLGSCLPPPTPLNIPRPEVPDSSVGTQFAQPGYLLESESEVEGCVATYYDVSASVPAGAMIDCPGAFPGTNETGTNAGKCFSYKTSELFQDAQSHHSIVHIYPGTSNWNDPGWGNWRCYGGTNDGNSCVPTDPGACPDDGDEQGVCGSRFHDGVACLDTITDSWGAPDFDASSAPQFSGSQESTADFTYPSGVYSVLPLKGLIVWNSHAFNHTNQDTDMNAWINMTYTDQRTYPAQGLFASQWIFTQNVPVFQQKEYCGTHTFPEGTRLFQLNSHTHKRGVRWRYYDAPQPPPNVAGSCYAPGGTANPACVPSGTLMNNGEVNYESYDYSDAQVMIFDPPKVFTGTAADRTIKFCSLYDNGFIDPADVKRQSTSPEPTGNLIFGGPCANSAVRCMGGPNKGQLCGGNDSNCPDSVCDACPLVGGVTTEDEMFIGLGTYYVVP